MKYLPIGIQTFSSLIEENYLYVDKTKDIYEFFARGGKYYFLSRPRRFGKSLLVSILKEIFSGNKELFKGLWIYDKLDRHTHPIIHLDFLGKKYGSPGELEETLEFMLNANARGHGIELEEKGYDKQFNELIKKLAQQDKVVILVDEYDKPIINHIENPAAAKENRDILRTFYEVLKSADEYIKFVFITGVSKFSKVSIFSGLNNLRDITMSASFSTLLGYGEAELQRYFSRHMKQMADKMGITGDSLGEKIRRWYNGYSWDGKNFVYNPLSILSLFQENSFENFWFSTGTPTFLTRIIKNSRRDISKFDDLPVSSYTFDSFDVENLEITPLLFQTGYLTIKEVFYINEKKRYRLSYPNKEVRDSFLTYLFQEYTGKEIDISSQVMDRIGKALAEDDLDRLLGEIKSLFASIPYHIFMGEKEAYYHTVIYLILKLSGADIIPEDPTNMGRLDAVLETGNKIYIMEFKIGKGKEQAALDQIKRKNYPEKFLNRGKEVILVGVGLDPQQRNIGNFVIEKLPCK
ncbi:MAG: ATP-binding protein [Candidatus Aminicenantes bacterium]|nr:ATP-binding protein [Candidatus Aminicenantes bacterium]